MRKTRSSASLDTPMLSREQLRRHDRFRLNGMVQSQPGFPLPCSAGYHRPVGRPRRRMRWLWIQSVHLYHHLNLGWSGRTRLGTICRPLKQGATHSSQYTSAFIIFGQTARGRLSAGVSRIPEGSPSRERSSRLFVRPERCIQQQATFAASTPWPTSFFSPIYSEREQSGLPVYKPDRYDRTVPGLLLEFWKSGDVNFMSSDPLPTVTLGLSGDPLSETGSVATVTARCRRPPRYR